MKIIPAVLLTSIKIIIPIIIPTYPGYLVRKKPRPVYFKIAKYAGFGIKANVE